MLKMGIIIKSLILSLLIPSWGMAQEAAIGGAFLASGHKRFPCQKIMPLHKASPNAYHATMWQTFGPSNTSAGNRCWRKYMKSMESKPHTLQFYLSNEVCRRKGNCYKQELNSKLSVSEYNKKLCNGHRKTLKKVKKRMNQIKDFCGRYGNVNTNCLLAVGLESQFSECAAKKLVDTAIGEGWDRKKLIHNPVHNAPYLQTGGAYYYEQHNTSLHFPSGIAQSRRIITLDGIDPNYCKDAQGREGISDRISAPDLQSWTDNNKNRVSYLGYWCSVQQGITGSTATSPDPRKRSPYVASRDINKFIAHAKFKPQSPGSPPRYNTKNCDLVMESKDGPGGFLWKESEHGGLVVLFPGKYKAQFKRVVVLKPSGARDKLDFSGWANPDQNGERQHYRSSKRPDQFPDRSVVRATFKTSVFSGNKNHCWKVEDASERND